MQQALQYPLERVSFDTNLVLGSFRRDGSSQLLPTLLHLGRILLWNELVVGGSCLAGLRHLSLQPFNVLATFTGLNHNPELAWQSAGGSDRMQQESSVCPGDN